MTLAFGTFNPNFYGISMAYGSSDILDAMEAYLAEDDLNAWEASQKDHDLSRLGILSTMPHEKRHFHDFLLSPFACESMVSRVKATASGLSVVTNMHKMPGQFFAFACFKRHCVAFLVFHVWHFFHHFSVRFSFGKTRKRPAGETSGGHR